MFRFAALLSTACLFAFPASAESVTASAAGLEVAQIRPSLPTSPDLVEPVMVAPPIEAPAEPKLAARAVLAPKILVRVDISDQTMDVVVDGTVIETWPVSTAGRGYITPTGSWTPYRMHKMWYSKKYNNAPMPNSIFFTGGYAIHATPHIKRLGKPASHGCVRLHPDNAKALFAMVMKAGKENMRVVVQN